MSSKFQFISNLELPLVGHNEDWLTNTWVYITTALIGALTGLTSIKYYFTGYEFGDAATIVFNYGICILSLYGSAALRARFTTFPM